MYISSFNTYFLSIKSDAITFCCYLVCKSVHQDPASQPNSQISDMTSSGQQSVFQSHRLYYDKVDAGFINDISWSLSPSPPLSLDSLQTIMIWPSWLPKKHADRCEITSPIAPVWKSSRKTCQPDLILLNKDSDLEKALSSSCPFDY